MICSFRMLGFVIEIVVSLLDVDDILSAIHEYFKNDSVYSHYIVAILKFVEISRKNSCFLQKIHLLSRLCKPLARSAGIFFH